MFTGDPLGYSVGVVLPRYFAVVFSLSLRKADEKANGIEEGAGQSTVTRG